MVEDREPSSSGNWKPQILPNGWTFRTTVNYCRSGSGATLLFLDALAGREILGETCSRIQIAEWVPTGAPAPVEHPPRFAPAAFESRSSSGTPSPDGTWREPTATAKTHGACGGLKNKRSNQVAIVRSVCSRSSGRMEGGRGFRNMPGLRLRPSRPAVRGAVLPEAR